MTEAVEFVTNDEEEIIQSIIALPPDVTYATDEEEATNEPNDIPGEIEIEYNAHETDIEEVELPTTSKPKRSKSR